MIKKALSATIFMLALGLHATAPAQDQTPQTPAQNGADKSQAATQTPPAIAPTDAAGFYQVGLAHYESKQFKNAVEAFKRAVRLKPDDADIHYKLGMAYYSSNQYKEAAESYKQAIRLRPDWSEAHFRLGWMYYVLGKKSSALAEYRILQKLNAEQAATLYRIIKEPPAEASASASTGSKKSDAGSSAQPDVKEETRVESRLVVSDSSQPAQPTDSSATDASSAPTPSAPDAQPSPVASPTSPTPDAPATAKESGASEVTSTAAAPSAAPSMTNAEATPASASPSTSEPSVSPSSTATTATASNAPAKSDASAKEVKEDEKRDAALDEAALVKTYRVGVGDVLDIRLANSPTTRSTLYTVAEGGFIEYPLAGGPINVSGLTTEEINARISAELKRRAVNQGDNTLLVSVRDYVSHSVVISGLVNNPGMRILHREAVPLYVVLADAQLRLEASRAIIMRTTGQVQVDLTEPSQMNVLVRPGDVIAVSTRPPQFYFIGGKIMTPGQKPFQPGITLVQAILAAGGLLDRVSGDEIDISREGEDGRLTTKRYKLKEIRAGKVPDPRLQPGDRIEVAH